MIFSSGRARIRSTVTLLAVATLAVTGAVTDVARGAPAEAALSAFASTVEDEGADCPVPSPGQLTANPRLPDPFTRMDGTRITTTSDWRCRRAEIRELAERYVYGEKPARPASVTGTVSASNITVNVTDGGRSASFSAGVQLPSGSSPVAGWTVAATLPAGASVTNAWNAGASGNAGTVQFTNLSHNGSVASGQSTEFGFQGTGTGTGMTTTCSAT